jgi:hypothetical protein
MGEVVRLPPRGAEFWISIQCLDCKRKYRVEPAIPSGEPGPDEVPRFYDESIDFCCYCGSSHIEREAHAP